MMQFNCVVGEKAVAKHAVIEAVKRNINADREERNNAFIFFYQLINIANSSPRVQSITREAPRP